jgi:hypothetical protein
MDLQMIPEAFGEIRRGNKLNQHGTAFEGFPRFVFPERHLHSRSN